MKINRRHFLGVAGAGTCAVFAPQSITAKGSAALENLSSANGQSYNWPTQQVLPSFPTSTYIDAADIRQLSPDQQLLFTTLQGVVNSHGQSLYGFLSGDNTDQTWLNNFQVPHSISNDPLSLIRKYLDRVQGAIVYDPNVPDTINVATSLAGLRNAVVTTSALAREYGLPVLEDLRGKFSNKLEAYNWLLDNYWPQLNHRLLAAISPATASQIMPLSSRTLFKVTEPVNDESNRGVYTADLSNLLPGGPIYILYKDAYPNGGWGPSVSQVTVTADGNTIASFQPGTEAEDPFLFEQGNSSLASGGWRFADGNSYFIYRFAPPAGTKTLEFRTEMWNQFSVIATNTPPVQYKAFANFRDYIVATRALVFWLDPLVASEAALFTKILQMVEPNTPYLGWFANGHENAGVTLCARHSVPVVAADFLNNGTVFGGLKAPILSSQPVATTPSLQNKVYLTLTMSEGDNLQFCQHKMRTLWDDPARGRVPINWSITPLLIDAAPTIMSYFQTTQTANDLFVIGPTGAGYTYPGAWPTAELPAFTEQTGRYMRQTGMDVMYALNRIDDTNVDLNEAVTAQYVRDAPLVGILSNWIPESRVSLPAGLPVITQIGIGSAEEGQTALAKATQNWTGDRPLFIALGILAWNMTAADVASFVESLAPNYAVVRGDVFFRLLRQSVGIS